MMSTKKSPEPVLESQITIKPNDDLVRGSVHSKNISAFLSSLPWNGFDTEVRARSDLIKHYFGCGFGGKRRLIIFVGIDDVEPVLEKRFRDLAKRHFPDREIEIVRRGPVIMN